MASFLFGSQYACVDPSMPYRADAIPGRVLGPPQWPSNAYDKTGLSTPPPAASPPQAASPPYKYAVASDIIDDGLLERMGSSSELFSEWVFEDFAEPPPPSPRMHEPKVDRSKAARAARMEPRVHEPKVVPPPSSSSSLPLQQQANLLQQQGLYVVEKIVGERRVKVKGNPHGRVEYRVKWRDFDDKTWEPHINVKDCVAFQQYSTAKGRKTIEKARAAPSKRPVIAPAPAAVYVRPATGTSRHSSSAAAGLDEAALVRALRGGRLYAHVKPRGVSLSVWRRLIEQAAPGRRFK